MSTVSVTLVTAANVVVPEEDSSGFLGGLKSGWKAFLGASSGVLTVLGAVLPFAVLLAIVVVPLLWWRRRRRAQRPPAPAYASWAPPAAGPGNGGGSGGGSGPNGGSGGSGGTGGPDGGSGGQGRRRRRGGACSGLRHLGPIRFAGQLRSPRWWIAFGEHRQRRHRAARAGAGRSRRTLTSPTTNGVAARAGGARSPRSAGRDLVHQLHHAGEDVRRRSRAARRDRG